MSVSNEEIHLQEVDNDDSAKNLHDDPDNDSAKTLNENEDVTYKQIKPMNRSLSSDDNLGRSARKYSKHYSKEFQLKDFRGNRGAGNKKEYSSLYILGPRNRIRVLAKRITESKYPFLFPIY